MENFVANLLPSLAGLVLASCYLPQIRTTLKTKDVSGMDVKFWILLVIALSMLFANSIYVFVKYGDWGYMLTEAANVGLAVVMLTLVLKYRKRV
jgi:uncharacterized protein with PQ loop repeat